jgi:carbonic anhydrase
VLRGREPRDPFHLEENGDAETRRRHPSFSVNIFTSQRELFERLTDGQRPQARVHLLFRLRINPNLLTQTDPGELFILRNAGNIIPPYGAANGGEAGTIEYAISALRIQDVIVCGHSHCGAMQALLNPDNVRDLPAVSAWLTHAEATRRIMKEKYIDLRDQALLTATVEENVLVQLENLRTHPSVAAGLSRAS